MYSLLYGRETKPAESEPAVPEQTPVSLEGLQCAACDGIFLVEPERLERVTRCPFCRERAFAGFGRYRAVQA